MKFLGGNLGVGFLLDDFGDGLLGFWFGNKVEHLFLGWERGEDGHDLGFGFTRGFLFLGGLMLLRFRAGDGELAAHEELVVEDFDGALRFVDIEHFDKPVALGAVGVAVIDDLDAADGSDSFEEFLEVVLGGLVGEVADVDAAVLDGGWITATAAAIAFATVTAFAAVATALGFPGGLAFRGLVAFLAVIGARVTGLGASWLAGFRGLDSIRTTLGARGTDGLLVETDGFQQLLPPAKLDGSGHRAALGLSGVLAAGLAAIASASA